jgi:hypothetical protein
MSQLSMVAEKIINLNTTNRMNIGVIQLNKLAHWQN